MSPQAIALGKVAARLSGWCAVLYVPYALWGLADAYLISICGGASSYGGDCASPGLSHYYELLTTALIAVVLLFPLGLWKLGVSFRDAWRVLVGAPNSALDSDTYSAPLRAPSSARQRGR